MSDSISNLINEIKGHYEYITTQPAYRELAEAFPNIGNYLISNLEFQRKLYIYNHILTLPQEEQNELDLYIINNIMDPHFIKPREISNNNNNKSVHINNNNNNNNNNDNNDNNDYNKDGSGSYNNGSSSSGGGGSNNTTKSLSNSSQTKNNSGGSFNNNRNNNNNSSNNGVKKLEKRKSTGTTAKSDDNDSKLKKIKSESQLQQQQQQQQQQPQQVNGNTIISSLSSQPTQILTKTTSPPPPPPPLKVTPIQEAITDPHDQVQSLINIMATKSPSKKFVTKPTQEQETKMKRALKEKIILIETKPVLKDGDDGYSQEFIIQGTRGENYTVRVANEFRCTCPDYYKKIQYCKHMAFVILKVLDIPLDHYTTYQKVFTPIELYYILVEKNRDPLYQQTVRWDAPIPNNKF